MRQIPIPNRHRAGDINMLMAELKATSTYGARRAIAEVDLFAHQHPWRTAGVVALTAAALAAVVTAAARRH